jgi:mono/diheme cytochrome c family protein
MKPRRACGNDLDGTGATTPAPGQPAHVTTPNHNDMNADMKLLKVTLVAALTAGAVVLLIGAAREAAQPAVDDPVARGKYLVTYGGCSDCHTPLKFGPNGPEPDLTRFLSGHPGDVELPPPELKPGPWFAVTAGMTAWAGPWGISYAANLTPDVNTGLGIWTEDMFNKAMRTGKHMSTGRDILPPMPWQNLAALTDADLKAIFAYLRTLPPVRNEVPRPTPPGGGPGYE